MPKQLFLRKILRFLRDFNYFQFSGCGFFSESRRFKIKSSVDFKKINRFQCSLLVLPRLILKIFLYDFQPKATIILLIFIAHHFNRIFISYGEPKRILLYRTPFNHILKSSHRQDVVKNTTFLFIIASFKFVFSEQPVPFFALDTAFVDFVPILLTLSTFKRSFPHISVKPPPHHILFTPKKSLGRRIFSRWVVFVVFHASLVQVWKTQARKAKPATFPTPFV